MKLNYIVISKYNGNTLKNVLKKELGLSERLIKKLKYNDRITCNQIPVHVNFLVSTGDYIEMDLDFVEDLEEVVAQDLPLDILFEDDAFIAVNKNPGFVIHPTFNHPTGTIANAIAHHMNQNGISKKIRPVSRLDRDTSGIILFAKNEYVQDSLVKQMHEKIFKKEYVGIVYGVMEENEGTIDLPIGRKSDSMITREITEQGSISITHYKVIENYPNASFLKFILETGRTHQIRVHCQAIGHPLLGETLYPFTDQHPQYNRRSALDQLISRQALHSHRVTFNHPVTKEQIVLEAPIPMDMKNVLEILRNSRL